MTLRCEMCGHWEEPWAIGYAWVPVLVCPPWGAQSDDEKLIAFFVCSEFCAMRMGRMWRCSFTKEPPALLGNHASPPPPDALTGQAAPESLGEDGGKPTEDVKPPTHTYGG